ncbi:hypothetical protein IMSHALPRED_003215 [Imshaugia aleurites]|uniref:Uncharacterized protein n=1 Tax=Imshaugia aleurites TaxID=172621 RepID=A0A8H3PJ56_9LECA|nr:hypothetical protein IMSHALPRED_003215 [Imshaugia aleurites]
MAIEVDASSKHASEISHGSVDKKIEVDESLKQSTQMPLESDEAQIEVSKSSPQAAKRSRDQLEDEIEIGESSKRPRLDERALLNPCGFGYTRRNNAHTSATPERTPSKHNSGSSTFKTVRLSSSNFDRRQRLDPKVFLPKHWGPSPLKASPTPRKGSVSPFKPNPTTSSGPNLDQLATDCQQGMKVLFFIDHATKGDAIHHNIRTFVTETSPEMKLLMSKYRNDRSRFQKLFFTKARIICAQLTSAHDFLELDPTRARRLAYFDDRCTNAHLSTLYSHIASAVDVPRILAARTPNEKAFKDLMVQVFIHSMEDLWCFDVQPSKQDLSAKVEKENKEDVYSRSRDLTDRSYGLPAAREMPGYLKVPLKAGFPRYVLFGQGPPP